MLVPVLATLGLFGSLMVVGVCVAGIVLLSSLHMTLGRCSRRNRTMAPAAVWLCMIPIFGVFDAPVNVVGDTTLNEFIDRKIDRGGDYAGAGRWWLAVSILGVGMIIVGAYVLRFSQAAALALNLLSIAWFALFVLY